MDHMIYCSSTNPYSDVEMRKNVVEKHFGNNEYVTLHQFESPNYQQVERELVVGFEDWKTIYLSASYQGKAKINKEGNVIKASVLTNIGLVGAIYIKK